MDPFLFHFHTLAMVLMVNCEGEGDKNKRLILSHKGVLYQSKVKFALVNFRFFNKSIS